MLPTTHRIHISSGSTVPALLPMGGSNPHGRAIEVNSHYLALDGRPWLPIMGEFHFSRYPRARWEEALRKMKAGGITVAATYIFWIHHEEVQGQLHWGGALDLRHFVELCEKVGLYAYPRIGPWAHGECRNGGFPDWLLAECGSDVRKDAPRYLEHVGRFYREIYRQVQGLLWKDGGPIIGIQIENELLNNAGHIQTLLDMAREIGFDVPLYTMTGWGPAEVPPSRQILPVFGGYPDAFWDRQVQGWSRGSRKHYFFSHLRDDNTIGADLNKRDGLADLAYLNNYPFGTCELGGGMQIAYHRRPLIEPGDVAAMALVKIGSGSNLQGYYMYHGGANPVGQHSTMQESQATGYWNDVPVSNYDFQAPLGQYGQARAAYHALRPLHLFLQDFGALLAPMPMTLPDETPASLDDTQTLRWSVRSDGRGGFVFLNNYQRIERLADQPAAQFEIHLPGETLRIPSEPVNIPSGLAAIWLFHLEIDGALLQYATVQPVCRLQEGATAVYVFFAQDAIPPEIALAAETVTAVDGPGEQHIEQGRLLLRGFQPGTGCCFHIRTQGGNETRLLILTQTQASRLWQVNLWGQDRILLCADSLYVEADRVILHPHLPGTLDLAVFPPVEGLESASGLPLQAQPDGVFARFTATLPGAGAQVNARLIHPAGPARAVPTGSLGVAQAPDDTDFAQAAVWQFDIPAAIWSLVDTPGIREVLLRVAYAGDAARLYAGEQLIDDQFYYGPPWEIGLSRFQHLRGQPFTLRILPLRKDAPIYLPKAQWPDFGGKDTALELGHIDVVIVGEQQVVKGS